MYNAAFDIKREKVINSPRLFIWGSSVLELFNLTGWNSRFYSYLWLPKSSQLTKNMRNWVGDFIKTSPMTYVLRDDDEFCLVQSRKNKNKTLARHCSFYLNWKQNVNERISGGCDRCYNSNWNLRTHLFQEKTFSWYNNWTSRWLCVIIIFFFFRSTNDFPINRVHPRALRRKDIFFYLKMTSRFRNVGGFIISKKKKKN